MSKVRESNMELLRIIAMFCVMILHADFAALGQPFCESCHAQPGVEMFRYILEALSIVSVNVFVLISGWFGIRPSAKSFGKFIFQVLFFSVGIFGVSCAVGTTPFTWEELLTAVTLTHPLYWFIPAYMGLFILSPVLNAFLDHSEERLLRRILIFWFIFQTIYGCIWGKGEDGQFQNGYSLISFVGLYLLAQYMKRYGERWVNRSCGFHAALYVGLSLIVCMLGFGAAWFNIDGGQTMTLAYSNPLVIAASLEMLLIFANIHFQSKAVNIIAAGSFSVFLVHLNPWFYFQWFKAPIRTLSERFDFLPAVGSIFLFLVGLYVAAWLVDQVRAGLWKILSRS